jgi:hypothetical protein
MRTMVDSKNPKIKLNVDRVLVLTNGWEYFLEKPAKNGIAFGLVCGFEDELGSVYLPEIAPYIISEAIGNMNNALPAIGWEWKDE